MYTAVEDSLSANNVVTHLNRILDAAHEKGMDVIFTSMSFNKGYPEIGEDAYGIVAAIKESGAFIRGSWGADIYENLNRSNSDIVIQKSTMCAFKNTSLKNILDEKGIKRLVFGGLVTDLCLETSIRSAYDHHYEVISLVDCMASLNQKVHETTVADNFPLFSKPMTHDTFIAELALDTTETA